MNKPENTLITTKRHHDYVIAVESWPLKEELDFPLKAVSCYLWMSVKDVFKLDFPSVKEVDYFFRDDPKMSWAEGETLNKIYEDGKEFAKKAYITHLEERFHELSLVEKIHFLRFLLEESPFEGEVFLVGKEHLVLSHSLKNLSQNDFKSISKLFLQYDLKFNEVIHEN